MKHVQYTVRIPMALDKAIRKLAEQKGTTPYAVLKACVKAGINAKSSPPQTEIDLREIVSEVATTSARLADLERMLDRTLFTACAAYCYARSAAMGGGKTDEILLGEINRAYDRQKALATGRS